MNTMPNIIEQSMNPAPNALTEKEIREKEMLAEISAAGEECIKQGLSMRDAGLAMGVAMKKWNVTTTWAAAGIVLRNRTFEGDATARRSEQSRIEKFISRALRAADLKAPESKRVRAKKTEDPKKEEGGAPAPGAQGEGGDVPVTILPEGGRPAENGRKPNLGTGGEEITPPAKDRAEELDIMALIETLNVRSVEVPVDNYSGTAWTNFASSLEALAVKFRQNAKVARAVRGK